MRGKTAPLGPITGFVGPNGYGKTLAMVALGLAPAMRKGVRILTNLNLGDYPGWEPLESWRQLAAFRNGIIALDEMNSILPAREFRAMPAQLVTATQTLRHSQARLFWTEPAWEGADAYIRRVTQLVYVCRGHLPDRYHRSRGTHPFPLSGRKTTPVDVTNGEWFPNRLFRWACFDATSMEEFTAGRAESMGHKYACWYWRPGHGDQNLYNSNEFVGLLDHLDATGVCPTCDGTRRRHACKCKTVSGRHLVHDHDQAEDEAAA